MAAYRAIETAAADLDAERDAAQSAAAAAALACRELVDQILAADAAAAAEWVAIIQQGWKLQDRLTGLARVSNGALLPHAQQKAILDQIDRRQAAIATNGLMLERHYYDSYLDRMAAEQEKRWLDYGRRLMNDADAAFDVEPTQ
jgi:hypothetical protein